VPREITGQKTVLRPIAESEYAQACAWRNDPGVAHLFYRRSVTPDQMGRDVEKLRRSATGDTLAITNRETLDFIGTLTYAIARKQGAPAEATLGILIGPEHARGRGLGADAINALGAWLAQELGVGKLLVEVKPGNSKAMNFYEKAGFAQRAIVMERDI
jgi:RimJ/RimL family protein N-acetyltransferase